MYRIVVSHSAEKEMDRLPVSVNRRMGVVINSLSNNPRPRGSKKLKGTKENIWRVRVGDYRVIYGINDEIKIIDIRKVGHRRDIYE